MKFFNQLFVTASIVVLLFCSCTNDNTSEPKNITPSCEIVSPISNSAFLVGDSISVVIEANDPDGNIVEVKLSIESTIFDTDSIEPFSFTLSTASFSEGDYQIKAVAKDNEDSSASDELTVIINPFPAPTNLTYTKIDLKTIKLDWMEINDAETGFKIDKKIGDNDWVICYATVGSNIITWTDTSADINKIIKYKVYAFKGENNTPGVETSEIDNSIPIPINLNASTESLSTTLLRWEDNSIGEEGFKIDRKIGTAGTWVEDYSIVPANTVFFLDNGLTSGTVYCYRISSYYSEYNSDFSNEILTMAGFVTVPSGSFSMGGATAYNGQPIHTVIISNNYFIGKHETIQKEWTEIMGINPSQDFGVGDDYPVYLIKWYDVLVYCNKRSIAEGLTPCYSIDNTTIPSDWPAMPYYNSEIAEWVGTEPWDAVICNWIANGYRMPTEAEWEYAARYDDGRTYPWGETLPTSTLCNSGNSGTTVVVGSYPSGTSKLGICDMAGNVYEWVWDWYATYSSSTQTNPTGPSVGEHRVLRGGSYVDGDTNILRSAFRSMIGPYGTAGFRGFRLVRTRE